MWYTYETYLSKHIQNIILVSAKILQYKLMDAKGYMTFDNIYELEKQDEDGGNYK
jgi:hypothetical protein